MEYAIRTMRILVIGDIMLDEWVYGDVDRLSPEAPIPILDAKKSIVSLGGAGNVLVNLNALGIKPIFIGGISQTNDGHIIEKMANEICESTYFFEIPQSFKKQRICGNQQQIVRIDTGKGRDITGIEIENILDKIGDVDIVLVADYGKGAVTDDVLGDLSDYCYQNKIEFLIDPYNKEYYYSEKLYCTLIKFNRSEAEAFTGIKKITEENLKEAGSILLRTFDTQSILITLGPEGMAYFDKVLYKDNPLRVIDNPTYVYDVCGAGDVVFSVLGYLMGKKYESIEFVIKKAVMAGKIAVSKKGTSVVKYNEIFCEE